MISMIKRIMAGLLAMALCVCAVPAVFAVVGIVPEKPVSLTVQFLENQEDMQVPVVGVNFQLYHVAVIEADGTYVLAGDFQNYPVEVNGLDAEGWRRLTSTLCNFISADALEPLDSGITGEDGGLYFPNHLDNLMPGLYLVNAEPMQQGDDIYRAEPFMITLPGEDAGGESWLYDVAVRVKYTKETFNPEETVERHVLKVWEGDAELIRSEEIQVELRGNGELYDAVTLRAENNWRHHWPELPRYDDEGKEIDWSIVELAVEDYVLTITLEGITFRLTNTYAPDDDNEMLRRSAMKVWDDNGYEDERPASIQVHLLCNGEVVDTRTLDENNRWKTTWEELPAWDESGNEIVWVIREEPVEGYEVSYSELGENTLITNAINKPMLPQTGMLWWPVPVLVALGLLMLVLGRLAKGRVEDA